MNEPRRMGMIIYEVEQYPFLVICTTGHNDTSENGSTGNELSRKQHPFVTRMIDSLR